MPPPRRVQDLLPVKRDRFGLLTGARCSPHLFSDIAGRLRLLGDGRETAGARAEVEAALQCPWWGLRVLAIRAVGRWGGQVNEAWLMRRAGQPVADRDCSGSASKGGGWGAVERGAVRDAVAPLLDDGDADWLIGIFLYDFHPFSSLYAARERMSDDAILPSVEAGLALSRGLPRVRLANLAARRLTLLGRQAILRTLADGYDEAAGRATQVLAEEAQRRPAGKHSGREARTGH